MNQLQRGSNMALPAGPVTVVARWQGPGPEADCTAYLLAEDGRVRGDQDMIFYNQPGDGDGAVALTASAGEARFAIDPARLPAEVVRIALCLTVEAGFASLSQADIRIEAEGAAIMAFAPDRAGASEAAMILGELYRRGPDWKFRAVGQGFDGGLAPLARSFGIEVDDDEPAPAPAVPSADPELSAPAAGTALEKKLVDKAPQLVSLAKAAGVSLAKHRLDGVKAEVILVLDRSGSMWETYESGAVQAVIDRILPLALHFDDDGALECWAFADRPRKLNSVTPRNVADFVRRSNWGWKRWCGNDIMNEEDRMIRKIMRRARKSLPTFVIFISDGGLSYEPPIRQALIEAAALPIFWQFVGLAGSSYGILARLDDLEGRIVDNADFFALDDFRTVPDAELYDRLLNEFPGWLTAARQAGILKS